MLRWIKKASNFITKKIPASSYKGQLLVAGIVAIFGFFIGVIRFDIADGLNNSVAAVRVALNPDKIPLSASHRDHVNEIIDSFIYDIKMDPDRGILSPKNPEDKINPDITIWELAQEGAALCTDDINHFDNVGKFEIIQERILNNKSDEGFFELEQSNISHDAITSWVMIFYARCNLKPPDEVYEIFASSEAHISNGWRRVHPLEGDERFASSYATTMGLWAINETRQADKLELSKMEKLDTMAQSYAYKIANKLEKDPGAMRDYPNDTPFFRSWALSGFAIYALDQSKRSNPNIPAIKRHWLDGFRDIEADSSLASMYRIVVPPETEGGKKRTYIDGTRYWDFPWILAANVSIYDNATIWEKAKILREIEHLITLSKDIGAFEQIEGRPWIKAEYVIALDHLRDKS